MDNGNNKISCRDRLLRYSAILGSTGVSAGAFGAHALKQMYSASSSNGSSSARLASLQDSWRTAVQYQLFHAAALLALSSLAHGLQQHELLWKRGNMMTLDKVSSSSTNTPSSSLSRDANELNTCKRALDRTEMGGKMMFYGTVLFSGSIYCLSLGIGPRKILGPITPIGGLLMIGGWIVVGMVTIS